MTRRFDRTDYGGKIHKMSLGAMEHFDFKKAGAHSYEQVLRTIRELDMPMDSVEEQFRRAAFNIIARNHDDHVKNIAFLMDRSGTWSLSSAFDVTYSYNPAGAWTSTHQMTLNGKRDHFDLEDFEACSKTASMKRGRARDILRQVQDAVSKWRDFASAAGIGNEVADNIASTHRMDILG